TRSIAAVSREVRSSARSACIIDVPPSPADWYQSVYGAYRPRLTCVNSARRLCWIRLTEERMPSKRSQPTKTIDGVVAEQIKALRKAQGSQQRLADLLGVPQSTVTRIESGERGITVGELFRIAAALNVAPVELLGASFQPQDVPVDRTRTLPPPHARAW